MFAVIRNYGLSKKGAKMMNILPPPVFKYDVADMEGLEKRFSDGLTEKIAGNGTETGVMRTECDLYAAGCSALLA
ncbi:MAG: hypothetical protein ACLRMN_00040 [Mediterraneibacter gnavus]